MFSFNKITHIILLSLIIFTPIVKAQEPVSLWFWTDEHRQQWDSQLKHVKALKKAHERDKIIGLELLIAEPSDSSPLQSRFGHAFLRFVASSTHSQVPSSDLTVNFVANVHTQQLSARAGLTGEYAILPEVLPLASSLNKYMALEKRPLRRIAIPSSPQMRNDLVEALLNWWDELEAARPHYIKKEQKRSQERALQSYPQSSRDELLLVELPHPNKGVLGYTVLELTKLDLTKEEITELKSTPLKSIKRLELLNRWTRKQMINELAAKMSSDQTLIQQGSYLHLVQTKELSHFWVKENQIPNGHIVAKALKGFSQSQTSNYLALPVEQWRKLKLETHAIVPSFSEVHPPRVSIEDLGRYTFLGQNCASTLIQYFEKAQLPARPGRTLARRIPLKLDEFLQESLLAPYPEMRLDKMTMIKKEIQDALGIEELNKLNSSAMTKPQHQAFETLLIKWPTAAQALFYFAPDLSEIDRKWLRPIALKNSLSFAELHGLERLPQNLYTLCKSFACSEQLSSTLTETFGAKKLSESKEEMQRHTRQPLSPRDYSRVGRRRHHQPHRVYYKRPELVQHLYYLDFLGPRFPLARNET
jgi:hypothetical protein